ncbi:MAG: phosphonate metabolism protein/1,5-bisphosphokinase (PRPP-forming) PhnN [Rhodospirillales bacterium]
MSAGRLIAVVGPSGVGKDSLIAGIVAAAPCIRPVRRSITRAAGLGGEAYEALTPEAFAEAARCGAFCLHWQAHGLLYGIPAGALEEVRGGATCLANLSRGALVQAAQVFPSLTVLKVTASAEALARRLALRGRENSSEIARRLAQADKPLPAGLTVIEVRNDGPLAATVASALAALQPVRA